MMKEETMEKFEIEREPQTRQEPRADSAWFGKATLWIEAAYD